LSLFFSGLFLLQKCVRAQSCERQLEDVGQPLLIAGVENMAPLVTAMTREWEIAMHNATLAAMGQASIPAPQPPPDAPPGGDAAADAAEAADVPADGPADGAAGEEAKIGDVVMGEAEVVDLVAGIEERPSEPKA
jgi:hypothetical protein